MGAESEDGWLCLDELCCGHDHLSVVFVGPALLEMGKPTGTLDGVMQAPAVPMRTADGGFAHGGWSFPYFSEDIGEVINEAFGTAECLLLGRRTDEIFAVSWPNCPDNEYPVASRLMRAIVVRDPEGHRFTLGRGEDALRDVADYYGSDRDEISVDPGSVQHRAR